MIVPILISIIVFLLVLGCGTATWFVLRRRQAIKSKEPIQQTTTGTTLAFHWSYVILPLVTLLLSIILTAFFYHRLPSEVAYTFQSDGSPDRWLSRSTVILWMLLPQLFLTLLAGAITWGITRLGALFKQPESTWIKLESILLLMGNMVALPQIILCFAMLRIFIYNSYQIHILPLWVFALIIMGLGGIILGIFFIRAVRQVWRASR
ncbi:DUF1648 domain-containing protein [Chloroflexota bacterium]